MADAWQSMEPRDQGAYDALQAKLGPLWSSLDHFNTDEQTIVAVPSADLDVCLTASHLQAYEERFLFLLFLAAPAPGQDDLRDRSEDRRRDR